MEIRPGLELPDEELRFTFARAGGPGGQNVNKVSSKAVLHWDVEGSPSLSVEVKRRLRAQNPGRFTTAGELVLQSQRHRDQVRNVQDCLDKLRELVLRALVRPKARRPTRPGRAARERRLLAKRQAGARKRTRRRPGPEE